MTSTEPAARAPTSAQQRALAIGLVLAVVTFAFDELAIGAVMPAIADDLGGVSLYGAAFSAFMLTNLLSLAVGGPLADLRGPQLVLGAGLAAFAVGLCVGGLAPTMEVVVLGRAIQGLGGGAIAACVYVVIGRAWPVQGQARMFAVMSGAWIIPSLLAPGLAGAVAEHLTWRLVFLGLLPFPFIAAALALPALHELGPAAPELVGDGVVGRKARVGGQLAFGLLAVLGGMSIDNAAAGAVLVVVGIALGLPALREILPDGSLRAAPGLPAIVTTRLLITWVFFGAGAFLPLIVTEVHGGSTIVGGFVLTSASLAWSAAAWEQTRLNERHSAQWITRLGIALLAAGLVVISFSVLEDVPLAVLFIGWTIAGAGMGLSYNTTSVAALARAPKGEEGATGSALELADAVGVSLATALGGAVVAAGNRGDWSASATLALVLLITGGAIVPALLASRRITPGEQVQSSPR